MLIGLHRKRWLMNLGIKELEKEKKKINIGALSKYGLLWMQMPRHTPVCTVELKLPFYGVYFNLFLRLKIMDLKC